jgi:hypothetical protein
MESIQVRIQGEPRLEGNQVIDTAKVGFEMIPVKEVSLLDDQSMCCEAVIGSAGKESQKEITPWKSHGQPGASRNQGCKHEEEAEETHEGMGSIDAHSIP